MDEKLLELISLLRSELLTIKSKLGQIKKTEEANPLDSKIKAEIAALEERIIEIESFKNRIEDKSLETTKKMIDGLTDEGDLTVLTIEAHAKALGAVLAMKNTMNLAIVANINIDELAFKHAEICLNSLDLSSEIPAGFTEMILGKFVGEDNSILGSVIPFAEEIIQLTQALFLTQTITKPNLEAALKATIVQKIIDRASDGFKITQLLVDNLAVWVNGVFNSKELTLKERATKLSVFTLTVIKSNIESNMDFANKANNMLVVAMQELFQKANVTVIQWCANADGLNTPDRQVPVKTSFTKDDAVNKIILDTIAKIGIPVTSTGALRPAYLQQLFPQIVANNNIIYLIHPSHEKSVAGELSDYTEQSPGSHYADKLKEAREKESWEKKLKQKEEEAWAKAIQEKTAIEMQKQEQVNNQKKEEQKEEINKKIVNDKPYGMNAGMEFQLGKIYDIGATFGINELDKWGNLDTGTAAARIKELAVAIKKLNPKKIIYSAFLDNSHEHNYNETAVYTGLSQFHDSLCHYSGLSISKELDLSKIYLLNSQSEVEKSRLGRFLEFK